LQQSTPDAVFLWPLILHGTAFFFAAVDSRPTLVACTPAAAAFVRFRVFRGHSFLFGGRTDRYNGASSSTSGGELGSTGLLKCGWRAVVGQWAT
jgi:hypothetical protein